MSLLSIPVPKALIEELEKRFPMKRPVPEDSFNKVLYESGQRDVVDFLRTSYEAQQNPEKAFKIPIK